ncbi:MAG: hypothetical protein RI575_01840 [Balneolaceae bacterium]|nr:hypothetical protein [Balneolaceae bacterium]MDR9408931.1 hypothetical protein [Balneolaceae bacterium]
MNRWQTLLIITGLLFANCSTSSEPEPEPQDIFFTVEGDAFPYDVPEAVQITASHPEGFADASIEVYVNGDELFTKNEQQIGTRFDTTFTPQADGPGTLRVEYNLRANADVRDVQGSRSIQIQDTPFAETTISFYDAVTRDKIDGVVTNQSSGNSYEIVNGEWDILRSDKIRKDALAQGLEIAIQSEGRLPTLDEATGSSRDHYQIPFNAPNFSAEEFFEFLHSFPVYMEREDDRMSHGYPMGTEVTAYIADRSTYATQEEEYRTRQSTNNENLWIAEGFKQDVIDMLNQFEGFIPPNNNLSITTYIESESDFEFPKGRPKDSFLVGSSPENYFSVDRGTQQEGGIISYAFMSQNVDSTSGPEFETSTYAACEEVFESFGALNTSANPRILCRFDGPTAKAKPMTYASLSLPPGSSWNHSTTATGIDGAQLNPVYVVKRE